MGGVGQIQPTGGRCLYAVANPAAKPITGISNIRSGRRFVTLIREEGRLGFRKRIGHDPLWQFDRRVRAAFDGRSWRSGMM